MFIRSGYRAQTRSSLGTNGHHLAPRVIAGGGNCRAVGRTEPRRERLALELCRRQLIEGDRVILDVALSLAVDRLPTSLEHQLSINGADRGRPTGVDDAVALAHVGEWLRTAVDGFVELEPLRDSD